MLVRADMQIKLADFGITVPVSGGAAGSTEEPGAASVPGAPEGADAGSDLRAAFYSLGATLYYAAAGQPPVQATAAPGELPLPLDVRVPGFPLALAQLIQRLLARDPARRPGSWDELYEELRAAAPDPSEPSGSLPPSLRATDPGPGERSPFSAPGLREASTTAAPGPASRPELLPRSGDRAPAALATSSLPPPSVPPVNPTELVKASAAAAVPLWQRPAVVTGAALALLGLVLLTILLSVFGSRP